jgi:multiple sugar transport system permease protein
MQLQLKRLTPAFSTIAGIILTALMLFPFYWMVANSLETTQQIFSIPALLVPVPPTLSPYAVIMQTQLPHLLTSLEIGLGAAVLAILIATPAAYALAHFRLRVTVLIVFFLLLSQMIPTVTLSTPMFLIFNNSGCSTARSDSFWPIAPTRCRLRC